MSTHNLCFEQKYEKYRSFYLNFFEFLEMKSFVYLNRHVIVMQMRLLWCVSSLFARGWFYMWSLICYYVCFSQLQITNICICSVNIGIICFIYEISQ